jgi:hypothetical protein
LFKTIVDVMDTETEMGMGMGMEMAEMGMEEVTNYV